ncbi:MAG: hypothetical protein RIS47_1589 [Bacteroidota bacterium]|jgi:nucleotide-binding universal stress UspA family protein
MKDQLVTLAVLSQPRAEILKGRLELLGIDTMIENEREISPAFPNSAKLLIHVDDVETALPVALHFKKELAISDEEFDSLNTDVNLILVPVDFSAASANAVEYAVQIAAKLNADIKLLHVFYDAAVAPVSAVDSYAYHVGFDVDLVEIENSAQREMDQFVKSINAKFDLEALGVAVTSEILGGSVEDVIIDEAESSKADLIIVGTQGVKENQNVIIGSIASYVVNEAAVPVLSVPSSAVFKGFPEATSVMYVTNFEDTDYLTIRKLMRLMYPFEPRLFCVHVKTSVDDQWDEIRMESLKDHLQLDYTGYEITTLIVEKENVLEAIEELQEREEIQLLAVSTHHKSIFEELFSPDLAQDMLTHTLKPLLVVPV